MANTLNAQNDLVVLSKETFLVVDPAKNDYNSVQKSTFISTPKTIRQQRDYYVISVLFFYSLLNLLFQFVRDRLIEVS
jgi:hypothetical protein